MWTISAWIYDYLVSVYELSVEVAGVIAGLALNISSIFGCIPLGILSDKYSKIHVYELMIIITSITLIILTLNPILPILLVVLGITSSSYIPLFTMLPELIEYELLGLATGYINTIGYIGGFLGVQDYY